MAVMPELQLNWNGTAYRCRSSMDTIMHIEQKVTVQQLAHRIATGAADGDIPLSHIAWVMFCLLRSANAPVYNVNDVWARLKANQVDGDDISAAMKFIIDETFGVGPSEETAEELAEATTSTKKKESGPQEIRLDELYKTAVGQWGIDPQSFWKMTPREWWLVFDSKMAQRPNKPHMRKSDAAELYELLQEAE